MNAADIEELKKICSPLISVNVSEENEVSDEKQFATVIVIYKK